MSGYRCFWGLVYIWVASTPATAIEISGVQPFALDQPRVYAMLQRPGQSGPLMDEFGAFTFDAFLDTGASGFILSREVAEFVGVQKQQFNGQDVEFATVGATGSAGFSISEVLNIGVAPYHPSVPLDDLATIATTYTQGNNDARLQIEQLYVSRVEELINVVGMPTMVNKVVVMDPTPVDDFLNTMNTFIYDPGTPFHPTTTATDPGIPETTHNVQLSFGDFSRFTQVTPAGGSLPTLARNPFIGPDPISLLDPNAPLDDTPPVELSWGGLETTGSFLLDTGAGVSFISRALASDLNIRYRPGSFGTNEPKLETYDPNNVVQPGTLLSEQFTLDIGGIGGSVELAGFYIDSMRLKTIEGDVNDDNDPHHLEFVRTPVLVNDIQLKDPDTGDLFTLTGVFGMNNLVASADIDASGGTPDLVDQTPGNFEWLVYDDVNALLGFTLKDVPIAAGDFNADGQLDCGDIDGLVTTLSSQVNDITYDMNADGAVNEVDLSAWLTAAGSLEGDADLDGTVGESDLAIWQDHAFSNDTSWCSADFNVDGVTDGSDFNVWLENHGATAAPLNASVPEPSGLASLLLLVAVVGPVLRRQR